jgi:hypothetical protein
VTRRSATGEVTFRRDFQLPEMDRAYPPGTYQIETDDERLDVLSTLAYRRVATRIRLHRPGAIEFLTISPEHLRAALASDAASDTVR